MIDLVTHIVGLYLAGAVAVMFENLDVNDGIVPPEEADVDWPELSQIFANSLAWPLHAYQVIRRRIVSG